MTGAEIVIKTLIEQGVDVVFGYPGGAVLNIYDELYKNSHHIRHILTAHEQGAAHAADGYARASGKVGVVFATSGPGATNLVTGIANAHLDSSPIVAITGNVPCSLIGRDSFQEVDIAGITMPIVKHNYIVKDVNRLADIIREAFMIAKSGRPGPVLIDIPKDIQIAKADFSPEESQKPMPAPKKYDQKDIDKAVRMINKSKRPFIYCGGGVVSGGAGEAVKKLADKIDAPIGFSMMGLSAIPGTNERNLGMVGMHGRYAAIKAKAEADLVIALGVRFSDRATGNKNAYLKKADIIHVDIDQAEIDKNIPVALGIVGNVGEVVEEILKKAEQKNLAEWHKEVEEFKAFEAKNSVQNGRLTPYKIIECVNKFTLPDTPVATDVGQHQMWVSQYYKFMKPRTFITSGGLGTMGFGMGAAIGASVATGKRTVLFTGDGSFGMNLTELATAVSQNVPLVIVLMNNGVLGMVRQWQTMFYEGNYSQTTLNRKTDFVKLADAFGAVGKRATSVKELCGSLEEAFETDGPVLIDCVIDMDERVLPMIPPNGTVSDLIIK